MRRDESDLPVVSILLVEEHQATLFESWCRLNNKSVGTEQIQIIVIPRKHESVAISKSRLPVKTSVFTEYLVKDVIFPGGMAR